MSELDSRKRGEGGAVESEEKVKPVRRDFSKMIANEDLFSNELTRFILAFTALKANEQDWNSLCAIHGDGYPPDFVEIIAPLIDRYMETYVKTGLIAANTSDFSDKDHFVPLNGAFCAHVIPLFFIWHRPYMLMYETLLQKYDPEPNAKVPLAAHYWNWDCAAAAPNGPIPEWATSPTLLKSKLPNPFINGIRKRYNFKGEPNPRWAPEVGTGTSSTIKHFTTGPLTTRDPDFKGLEAKHHNEVYQAVNNPVYAQITDMNNNLLNFETPHNYLHNFVGGTKVLGDMEDASSSSWDPIFWFHHSNIERQQCAWFDRHEVPTTLKRSDDAHEDMINYFLFPFPPKAVLESAHAYEHLPHRQTPEFNKTAPVASAREWLVKNEHLTYEYDDLKNVGYPLAASARVFAFVGDLPRVVERVVTLKNIPVRGSGIVKVTIRVGEHVIALDDTALFGFSAEIPCVNCIANPLNLKYEVKLTELEAHVTHPELSLVSAVFYQNGYDPEGKHFEAELVWSQ
eukprot:gene25852-32349_t